MRAEVTERRRAVLERLLDLRAAGHLQTVAVDAAAASLGVKSRTVWRWLANGQYEL
jgi:hypothetical protein